MKKQKEKRHTGKTNKSPESKKNTSQENEAKQNQKKDTLKCSSGQYTWSRSIDESKANASPMLHDAASKLC